MSQYFRIHPDQPQGRLIRQAVAILRNGGVAAYPTDSGYALGCQVGNKPAIERIWRIRGLNAKHHFTLICRDLTEVGTYASFDTPVYRLLQANTPGAYTFILRGTREVPRRLMHPKRKTIGIRVPDNEIAQMLLAELGEPIMSSTLTLPGEESPLTDPEDIRERLGHEVDLVIDGGVGGFEPSSVIDLTGPTPVVVRRGRGDVSAFE